MAFVVLFVLGLLVGLRKRRIFAPAAGPKWSLDSWASTLTTAGGILGTVLGAATLPEIPREIDKDTLVRLNLLFGILVLVGPFLFQAIRNPFVKPTDQDAAYTGWNLTLLLACAITGAAVVGELATLGLLGWELAGPGDWGTAAVVAVVVLAVAAAYYFLVTVIQLVTTDWKNLARQDAKKAADDAAKPQRYVVSISERVDEKVQQRRLEVTLESTTKVAAEEQRQEEIGEAAAAPEVEVIEPRALGPARRWKLP
jgi:hypothetical protein